MQVVELVNEPLELGHGVVALVGGESLIDGEGHGLDCGAHLADGLLIVLWNKKGDRHRSEAELTLP